jgi:hypothetical protein
MYRTYTAQVRGAFAPANRRPGMHNLFMNHHPILAFAPNPRTRPTSVYPHNGRSRADVPLPRPIPAGATPAPGATIESIVSTHRGYLTLERDAATSDAWRIGARDRHGRLFTTCALREGRTRCAPEALP